MREGRGRGRVRLVPADFTGVRELFAALKRREAAGFLPDQVPGGGRGRMGSRSSASSLTPRRSRRSSRGATDIACFLAYAKRLPRGAGYAITIRPYPGDAVR